MLRKLLSLSVMVAACVGCGPGQGTPLSEPVNVSGAVTADGKPLGNVVLNLQPLENGYAKIIPVKADGKFSVETQPGKYAYYFTPAEKTKAVPPAAANFVQASMDRTVQVASGKPLDINLK